MESNPVLKRFKVPESNLFLMTRFRETQYHKEISQAIGSSVGAFGLEFVRADDANWSALTLWDRVHFCIDACRFGVAVFETIDEDNFNPNVSFELGWMLALDRKCLLLKEKSLRSLPSDLCGHMYKEFDSRDITSTVSGQLADWMKEVGVRKRDGEKLVVFVSEGGTCRCAMAKAITESLLRRGKQKQPIRVESRAINPILSAATQAAMTTIKQITGSDLLREHHPRRAGVAFLFEADLILAMDRDVLGEIVAAYRAYPGTNADRAAIRDCIRRKSFLVNEFFGDTGDVKDPFPDDGDEASLLKYGSCGKHLHGLISGRLDAITTFLSTPVPKEGARQTVALGTRQLTPWR
jgi:protein-tyrosine-phosphatase